MRRAIVKQWAVRVEEPNSGRVMEVYTDQPGVQFYTGNFLDGTMNGVGGAFKYREALCLETQHFPEFRRTIRIFRRRAAPGRDVS